MRARRADPYSLIRLMPAALLVAAALLFPISSACAAPSLPGTLHRGLPMPGEASFSKAGIGQGELAVDFTLKDTKGQSLTLSQLLSEKPVVLIIGSFT